MLKKIRYIPSWKLYLLGFFLATAIVLLIIGEIQKQHIQTTIQELIDRQLTEEAGAIRKQLDYRNSWSLEGYREEAIDFAMPSVYYVISDNDGNILDVQGTVLPGIRGAHIPSMRLTDMGVPKTIHTPFNENWRLLQKQIQGGWVVVGWRLPGNQLSLDSREHDDALVQAADYFGNSIDKAKFVSTRHLSVADIDYAVFDSSGNYLNGNGGIPLKVELPKIDNQGSRIYMVAVPIDGMPGKPAVGKIVLAKDRSSEFTTIHELDRLNGVFIVVISSSTFVLGLIFFAPSLIKNRSHITIDDALKVGEGKYIEFKSTFQCNVGSPEKVNEKRLVILKAIAGFLNADGGTLFIGIMEQPPDTPLLRGLPEDLSLVDNNTDTMRRTLISLIADKIGKQFSDFIDEHLEERSGKLCWVISVARSPEPAFVRWKADGETKEHKHFYVREGPRTADLDPENMLRYIRNRWKRW